jgi:hypothetical protein
MPTDTRRERLLTSAALAFFQTGIVPARHPAWQRPGYWSFPVVRTTVRPVADTGDWVDVVTFSTRGFTYKGALTEWVATGFADMTGLQFRHMLNDAALIVGTAGQERHRDADSPPLARQAFPYLQVPAISVYRLQCRNTTGADKTVVAGVFGHEYYDPFSAGEAGGKED